MVFCRKLNWDLLAAALESLSGRLSLGVADDILPLARLGPEVGVLAYIFILRVCLRVYMREGL